MTKIKVKCNERTGGCGVTYEIEAEQVKEDYFQCLFCSKISKNPLNDSI